MTPLRHRPPVRAGAVPGIDVIAEGIEQQGQYDVLRAQGCNLFQGELFGKAMEIEAFDGLVFAGMPAPATAH